MQKTANELVIEQLNNLIKNVSDIDGNISKDILNLIYMINNNAALAADREISVLLNYLLIQIHYTYYN